MTTRITRTSPRVYARIVEKEILHLERLQVFLYNQR